MKGSGNVSIESNLELISMAENFVVAKIEVYDGKILCEFVRRLSEVDDA